LLTFSVTHYENPTMLSRVTAKMSGDVFEVQCTMKILTSSSHFYV